MARLLPIVIAAGLIGCADEYQGSPSGAGISAAMGGDAGAIDKASIVEGYKISPLDWETGGVTPDGVYYSASVPGIEITATSAPGMTEADLDRALGVALQWCQAQGKRAWESGDPEGRQPDFYDVTWHMPGRCLD
jgi:hypothetical protein